MSVFTRAALAVLVFVLTACGAQEPPGLGGHKPKPRDPSPPPPQVTARWSDPSSWPGGQVPGPGSDVHVPAGTVMLLDVSTPPLASLTIDGALVLADDAGELELTADWIMVHGGLYAGTSARPYRGRAVITLTGPETDDSVGMGMGTKFLAAMGGTIELYGDMVGTSWTRLTRDARAGDEVIYVEDGEGWKPGERIVIASTDFAGYGDGPDEQVEERTVVAVAGAMVMLDEPLRYFHKGTQMNVDGVIVDQRAEVARLDRNILIRGDEQSDDGEFGGHVMVMSGGRLRMDAVELYRMGQRGRLARYPIHWHQVGDGGAESYVKRLSIHGAYHRCVTIHGTNHVLVEDVVGYGTYGHCFFLEDGDEVGNELYRNLALSVMRPPADDAVLPSDHSFLGPAGFWVTNPANDLVGNVAASSRGSGFWYALPQHPTGLAAGKTDMWPQRTPLGLFVGNVAHSNRQVGLHVDNGPSADLRSNPPTWYEPRLDPEDESTVVPAVFKDFVAYKHRDSGAWFRGSHLVLEGGVLSDNARGVTFAADESGAVGVAFVGETPNLGTWPDWDDDSEAAGRHLPRPWQADYTIRGYEFYDGTVYVKDSTFVAYASNATRQAAALSYLDFTAFATAADNWASGLQFAPGVNRVYLHSRTGLTGDYGEDGYRSAVFRDVDGSVTGTAGRWVTVNSPFLAGQGCSLRAEWNAQVCDGRYVNLTFDVVSGPPAGVGPVTVQRDDGPEHVMYGSPNSTVPDYFRTSARYGYEYEYAYAGSPSNVRIGLTEGVGPGDEVIVSLPWSSEGAWVYPDWWVDSRNRAPQVGSLSALRASASPAYYLGGGRLWLKLLVREGRDWAYLNACTTPECG